jgi:8-oxo-dGTP pyrophosphatase MutT (NUDIX family)
MIARRAAVAVVVADGEQGDEVLIILRATVEGDPWSGHLALPGGGSEPEDSSLEATARRETLEETGIDLSGSACVATLSTVTPHSVRLPSISISPYVFRYTGDKRITISHEVADAWWIPIADLQRENAWSMTPVEVRDGSSITARGFQWRGHTLWGLTERILYEFLARLSNV